MRGIPFGFESLPRESHHFLLGRVVDEHVIAFRVDSDNYNVVKGAGRSARPQADDERTALFDVIFKIPPISLECEGPISGLLKIFAHGARGNPVLRPNEEGFLDSSGVSGIRRSSSALNRPVLHDHGNGSRTAAVYGLRDIGNVDPNPRRRSRNDAGISNARQNCQE